ncbi:MAG: DNA-protecting protein DprA, partial [Clostridiales bacterium]|nr:DNA-protecting protein DprA [Clostridiales bacterium]
CPAEYWIWLQRALGAGARTDEILGFFGNPYDMYEAGSGEWRASGIITPSQYAKLKKHSPSQCYDIKKHCAEHSYDIVTYDSEFYPPRLRDISSAPLVLYVWGDRQTLTSQVMVSVVGTRQASRYAIEVTQKLSRQLSEAGAVIVSGAALGVDSEAHAGAMLAKGKTIALLGCGLSVDYLKENAPLRRAIARNGAVVSEFFPDTPANRSTFPIRNRLISGISLGTLVIEAGEKSGSLITANFALEQGRDVFAVPGDVISSSYTGANKLIRDGAKPVFSAMDIMAEYAFTYPEIIDLSRTNIPISAIEYTEYRRAAVKPSRTSKPEPDMQRGVPEPLPEKIAAVKKSELPAELSPEAKKVYSVFSGEAVHVDDIKRLSGLPLPQVLAALTELEMYALIALESGKNYITV